jgi:hypothetical protein
MVWDKEYDNTRFTSTIKVDILLLSGRPKVKLKEIIRNVRFNHLLIAANNPNYMIEKWENEAAVLSLNCRVLKKNPAYNITLN